MKEDTASVLGGTNFIANKEKKTSQINLSQKNKNKLSYLNDVIYQKLGCKQEVKSDECLPNSDALSNNLTNLESGFGGKSSLVSQLMGEEETEISLDYVNKGKNLASMINEMNKKKVSSKHVQGNKIKISQNKVQEKAITNNSVINNLNNQNYPISTLITKDKNQDNKSEISNSNLKLNLDFIEIKSLKLTASKTNFINSVNDILNFNSGSIRVNLNSFNLENFAKVLTSYEVLLKKVLNKILASKKTKKSDNLVEGIEGDKKIVLGTKLFIKETYELKQLINKKCNKILDSIKKSSYYNNNILSINDVKDANQELGYDYELGFLVESIKEYGKFISEEIKSYDINLLEEGRHEVNYFFNILGKNKIELSAGIKDICLVAYNTFNPNTIKDKNDKKKQLVGNMGLTNSLINGVKNDNKMQIQAVNSVNDPTQKSKLLGKIIIPNPQIKFKLSTQKISYLFNESEMEFYDIENWREIISNIIMYTEKKINLIGDTSIRPFINEFLKNQVAENEEIENNLKKQLQQTIQVDSDVEQNNLGILVSNHQQEEEDQQIVSQNNKKVKSSNNKVIQSIAEQNSQKFPQLDGFPNLNVHHKKMDDVDTDDEII